MLYRPAETPLQECTFRVIPYSCWPNRNPGEMLIWLRDGASMEDNEMNKEQEK